MDYINISIETLKRANAERGHHWFEPGALRFFRSRVATTAYRGPGGTYFVSSEQFHDGRGRCAPRAYTVRRANADGSIDTVGPFNTLARDVADRVARKLADGERVEGFTVYGESAA